MVNGAHQKGHRLIEGQAMDSPQVEDLERALPITESNACLQRSDHFFIRNQSMNPCASKRPFTLSQSIWNKGANMKEEREKKNSKGRGVLFCWIGLHRTVPSILS